MFHTNVHVVPDERESTDAGPLPKVHGRVASTDSAGSASPAPTVPLQTWIKKINEAFGFRVGWVVEAGDLLVQSKQQLRHGEWSLLFGPGKLKFGLRKAEMLMAVARHPILRDSNNFSSLPTAWSALYVLSKASSAVVEQGISRGYIHSQMKLAEARQLVRRMRANIKRAPNDRALVAFNPVSQRHRLERYLRDEVARWPEEYRRELAEVLQATALQLLAEGNADSSCLSEGSVAIPK